MVLAVGCAADGLRFGRTARTVETHPVDAPASDAPAAGDSAALDSRVRPVAASAGETGRVVQADYQSPASGDAGRNDSPFRDSRPLNPHDELNDRPVEGGDRTIRDASVRPVAAVGDTPTASGKTPTASGKTPTAFGEMPSAPGEMQTASGEMPADLSGGLDAATLRLIDAEFRDATPQEREEWYETLRGVDRSMVPHILRSRRSMIERAKLRRAEELAETTAAGAASAVTVTPRPSLAPGSTDTPPAASTPPQTAALPPTATPAPPLTPVQPAVTAALASPRTGASPPTAAWPPNEIPAAPASQTTALAQTTPAPTPGTAPTLASFASEGSSVSPGGGRYPLANDWDESLQNLIALLEQDIARRPAPASDADRDEAARRHVFLRMLYLMDGQQGRTMQAVPGLSEPHQEFWTQLFWGLGNYFDSQGIPDARHRATEAVTQMRAAAERLQPEAKLQLRGATFCRSIQSFGNFDRFDRDEFAAGQPVLVYLEVRNFQSDLNAEGRYQTRLRTDIEIHRSGRGPQAGLVHSARFEPTTDVCRTRRQDYFNSYRIDLPADLTAGPHTLKLMVEDELSHRVATTTLNFVVR